MPLTRLPSAAAELVIRCNAAGIIAGIEQDTLGICRSLAPGEGLAALADPHSRSKTGLFFETLRREGVALHWELVLMADGRPTVLTCAGGHVGEGRYCVVATTADCELALVTAIHDALGLGSEARSTLQSVVERLRAGSEDARSQSGAHWIEIARLNNELIGSQRELTRQKAALQRTIEALRLALDSNSELERFAAVVSHDLAAPARQVRQLTHLFSHHSPAMAGLDERSAGWLRHIAASALRMEKLVGDTLAYARLGGPSEPLAPVPLNEVVDEAAATLADELAATGGRVERDADLPEVRGSRVQLAALFQNLIDNAVKYRVPGLPPVIRITAGHQSEAFWSITVRDNGIGIAPEHHERIFEMYTRLGGAADLGNSGTGSGIGLAACRRVMALHGGTIRVESAPGAGAAFHLMMPFAKPVPGGVS